MRLIDADALADALFDKRKNYPQWVADTIGNMPDAVVRCKDCKWRSYYCTEATDGTTLYTCHYPCANDVPRPADWFCADGEKRE